MYDEALKLIQDAQHIVVVQAENPDGDSLASSIALEEILGDLGKQVTLYCPIEMPKYLRYIHGWDRVVADFPDTFDLAVIVDTAADVLLSKVLETPGVRHALESHPVLVIDHHTTPSTLSFEHTFLSEQAAATGNIIFTLAEHAGWSINPAAAEALFISIMSDTLGLTTESSTVDTFRAVAKLVEYGAVSSEIEARRREYMKKSPEILAYKGQLIDRIEYLLEGKLALIHIPWDDIREYSDQYNPSVLVLPEMKLVENVEVAVAIKTYPDGKATGKIQANTPIAEQIASYFGGGGHTYAAGFRVYDSYEQVIKELTDATAKALESYHETI